MTTILVTGATGFLGRHVVARLLADGHRIRAASRSGQGSATPGVEWVQIPSLDSDTDWSAALEGVDAVIHLAALAHQMGAKGEGRADEFMAVNAGGTESLARAISRSGSVRRMVFLSSIGAVQSLSDAPLTGDSPCRPDTDYGRSKLAAEEAMRRRLEGAPADWCILRPCLIFGAGNPGNMARLISLLRTGFPLPFRSIRSRRTYAYVENLADAIAQVAAHPAASRRTFLYADSGAIEFPSLLRMIGRAAGLRVRLFSCPTWILRALGRGGDLLQRMAGRSFGVDTYSIKRLVGGLEVDASAFQNALNWSPPYQPEEAFRRTFQAKSRP